jgi:hypothetical protein
VYFTGDATSIDADGYVWFSGRADEIIKIADHRIGTIEVETAFPSSPRGGRGRRHRTADELRGMVISAFVVLKQGHTPSDALKKELLATVRSDLGPVAVIGELNFVDMLPKTRSGKIMRRVLKAVILGKDPGDISTIEDEGSVEEAREAGSRCGECHDGELKAKPPWSAGSARGQGRCGADPRLTCGARSARVWRLRAVRDVPNDPRGLAGRVLQGSQRTSNDYMRGALPREERIYSRARPVHPPVGSCVPRFLQAERLARAPARGRRSADDAAVVAVEGASLRALVRKFHASTYGRSRCRAWLSRKEHHEFAGIWRSLGEKGELAGPPASHGATPTRLASGSTLHYRRSGRAPKVVVRLLAPHSLLHMDTRSDNTRLQENSFGCSTGTSRALSARDRCRGIRPWRPRQRRTIGRADDGLVRGGPAPA